MEKPSLYKLPKDILIDLLMKSYDFDKLSTEQVYEIHKSIHKKCREKYKKELDTNIQIMKTDHNIANIKIWMDKVNLDHIYIGNILRIALFTKQHHYRFFFTAPNISSNIRTLDELIEKSRVFLKDLYKDTISEEDMQKIIDQIRIYAEAFDKKQFLTNAHWETKNELLF